MYSQLTLTNKIDHPKSSYDQFVRIAKDCVNSFLEDNPIIAKLESEEFTLTDYHNLLSTLFHQVYYSSSSFALAGTMVDSRLHKVREYLLEHAEEEKEHWTWIINDLFKSGFNGKDPRECFPVKATQAYISFAMFIAHKHPVSRLAMAYVLEDLSGKFGVKYGKKAASLLGLSADQVSFTIQHGELDQGHSHDILKVLSDLELSEYEWAHCCHVAKITIELYKDMYRHASSLTAK